MTRTRVSIGVQLVGLLIVSLLAAQLISVVTILLTPPPRPDIYRVSDIAAVLKGGSITGARPLKRTRSPTPPEDRQRAGPWRRDPSADALAAALGQPADRVRLIHVPPRAGRVAMRVRIAAGDMGGGRPPPPHRDDFPRPDRGWDEPVFGEFIAAAELTPGTWTIVTPEPEGFPSEWHMRIMMWLLAGFVVVAPAGLLFARRITAPLKRFSAAAEQLGRDPQGPQALLSGPAEIGAAAEAFNRMQRRLKRFIDDRTAMVGAVSHDLRTPLARIRFKLERADPKLRDSVLGDILQMEQMLAGVLAFIRNESDPSPRERIDLLSLVECVVDNAAQMGADVQIVDAKPVMVEGDLVSLQRLFANVVDNAVKYGCRARVEVGAEAGLAQVLVADEGPGIPADEIEAVFRPFYRVDPSRNMDTGGIGLGLSIARSAARSHGGDVSLSNGPLGLKALVTLPLAAA